MTDIIEIARVVEPKTTTTKVEERHEPCLDVIADETPPVAEPRSNVRIAAILLALSVS